MSDAKKVAERAIELARRYLEADSRELAQLAGGNMDVLREAARVVQQHQSHPEGTSVLSPEHLAFTLITAAYDILRREHRPDE